MEASWVIWGDGVGGGLVVGNLLTARVTQGMCGRVVTNWRRKQAT